MAATKKKKGDAVDSLPTTLRTGVRIIDEEHEYLLRLQEQLKHLCTDATCECEKCGTEGQAECEQQLSRLIAELLSYVVEHFRHEEAMFRALPVAMQRSHSVEHADISQRLTALLSQHSHKAVLACPSEVHDLLTHWLEDHIRNWDIPVANYLLG